MNLDGFVNNLAGADRHHCLDGAHHARASRFRVRPLPWACDAMRRIDSISIRAAAMTSGFLPRLAMRFRMLAMPRFTAEIKSFSAAPTEHAVVNTVAVETAVKFQILPLRHV